MSSFLSLSGLGRLGDDSTDQQGGTFLDTSADSTATDSGADTGTPTNSVNFSSILNASASVAAPTAPAAVQALSPNVPQSARSFLNMFIPAAPGAALSPNIAAPGAAAGLPSWVKWAGLAALVAVGAGVFKRRK